MGLHGDPSACSTCQAVPSHEPEHLSGCMGQEWVSWLRSRGVGIRQAGAVYYKITSIYYKIIFYNKYKRNIIRKIRVHGHGMACDRPW